MTDFSTEIANGMAWLDENEPGWTSRVSPALLDMADPERCVLGQLYGNYFASAANAAREYEFERGFNVIGLGWEYDYLIDALTEQWREAISSRKLRAAA